jgi:hypothetical protein
MSEGMTGLFKVLSTQEIWAIYEGKILWTCGIEVPKEIMDSSFQVFLKETPPNILAQILCGGIEEVEAING